MQEKIEIRISKADLSIWVTVDPEIIHSDAKETLKMLHQLKDAFGPHQILEQLAVLLGGKIHSVDFLGADKVEYRKEEEVREYRLRYIHWAKGKSLAEVDPKLLRYAVDMGLAGVDSEAIMVYLNRIGYQPTISDDQFNDYDDDEIPF